MKSKVYLSVLCFLLGLGLLNAQLSQTGSLGGQIVAEDGSAIPGVSVEVQSSALVLEKMTTISNEEGHYRFRNLPPGTYAITFKLEGMKTLTRKGIDVSVSSMTTLNVAMEFGTLTENIEVSGKAPTIDVQATAKTTNISTEMIQSIPTRNRDLAGIFGLIPGVQGDNEVAHGGGERNNAWNIDGVNTNDPVVGTRGTTPAADVLQEVAVSVGGIGADQASSGGAIVNAVTKSGGNEFSGSASIYYNHESFNGDNTKDTVLAGSASGEKFNFQPAVSLGGPIVKNKLWFFGSYNLSKSETYVQGYPYNGEEIAADWNEPFIYGKLTWQPGAADKIYFSYNYSDLIRNHRGAANNRPEGATRKQDSVNHSLNIDWSHTFSNNFFGSLKVASAPVNFGLHTKNSNPYLYDLVTEYILPESSYGYSDIYKRSHLQMQMDFTLFVDDFVGQHEWKAGADMNISKGNRTIDVEGPESSLMAGYQGYWTFYRNGDILFSYFYKDTTQTEKMRNISAYIQDTWNPIRKLTFTLGLRFNSSKGIIPVQNENASGYFLEEFYGTAYPLANSSVNDEFTAMTWNNVAPRLAFSYDFAGDGKTVLKGSYGRYYEGLLTQYFSTVNPNQGGEFSGYIDEAYNILAFVGASVPEPGLLGYNGKEPTAPYQDEFTVGIEREIAEDWSLTLRGIYKEKRNMIEDADVNGLDIDALINDGELIWTNWQQVPVSDPVTGNTLYFWEKIDSFLPTKKALININGKAYDYKALELVLKKRFSKGWMMEVSYVLSKLNGLFDTDFDETSGVSGYYDNPNDHVNAVGRLGNDRRHYLKLLGMARIPFGINLSGVVEFKSGNPYSRWLDSTQEGISLNGLSNDTIIAGRRGEYTLPNQFNLDVALEKQFRLDKFNFAVFLQAFNVFNSGVADDVETTTSSSVRPFGQMTSITDPFYLRIGARIEFN